MAPVGVAVVKALYDYEAQSEDELSVKEDQILYVLDNADPEWWKVRHKTESSEEEGPSGVVPATYVEEVEPIGIVRALYDYDAGAEGELSIKEGDVLIVYEREDDWILVKGDQRDSKVGFVPGTYVQDHNPDDAPPAEPASAEPVSNYVDPQERVLASAAKPAAADNIETWPVTEIDTKGKKKKGTLGIGKGNVFFASESDKTPVQQWKAADITSVSEDKPKHVLLVIAGPNAAELHFNAGSKEVAQAIVDKAHASSGLLHAAASPSAQAVVPVQEEEPEPEDTSPVEEVKPKKNGVRWAPSPTSPVGVSYPTPDPSEGESATAMYDFEAQSEDELTVREGDALVVVDRVSSEDWWKCRNERGQEGVVPSSYVELESSEEAAHAAAEAAAEERAREEEAARAQAEAESEAEAAAAAARAARDREIADERRRQAAAQKRRDDERKMAEQRRVKEEDRARRKAEEARALKAAEARRAEEAARAQTSAKRRDDGRPRSKSGQSERTKPTNTRIWHDKTGQFRVEAEFLGYANGKLKLHKINGVIIEVPSEKMSPEDMAYVDSVLNPRRKPSARADSDDNVPLATIADQRKQTDPQDRRAPASRQATGPKKSKFDWFEFFLNAGCDIDDCTRYSTAFERDKIDESILGDIKPETMRALGLREGDIIRVAKAIEDRRFSTKSPTGNKDTAAADEQLLRDEEYARQLQAEINGNARASPSGPSPPNLFTGPGGTLKTNQRRGRPQTKTSAPLAVDVSSIAFAGDRLTQSPAAASPSLIPSSSSPAPVSAQRNTRPLTPAQTGFDDNAWEPKPLSKPATATPAAAPMIALTPPPQAPVTVPPTPPASAPLPPQAPAPPAPTSVQMTAGSQIPRPQTSNAALTPAQTGEFELLAKLSQMRPPSAPVNQMTAPTFVSTPPPAGFQAGLGMGSSPVPLAQLQAQQTGMYFQNNGPRGPLAPVPANQQLLNPLIPTNTGFAGFIPTRPTSTPLMPQPNLLPQPTGYPSFVGGVRPQPTGFPTFNAGLLPNNGFQPQPTGFNPAFAQMPQGQFTGAPVAQFSQPPPQPAIPSQQAPNHSPASVFASMKSGSFAAGDGDSQPAGQIRAAHHTGPSLTLVADKYDALRSPNGGLNQPYQGFLTAQPTGFAPNNGTWNPSANAPGFGQTGFGGYQQR
ncbi:hypothetical protein CALVIDRAFT_505787 [Calocera viscosa TUFC12733]|uniref:Actin cytoskeleton-regulatory complex protein SLA1 n=1 Tax=Calocera viscosa (strain TUFC12733) TaxID=1330018 RepID=A0A167H955_CALVF|nr:hypothetical protein CALVIDRAFT_505787 [Calocera viscosa TUFC12733]